MFSVQPADEATHGSAFDSANATTVLRKQVDLAFSSSQSPSPAGASGKVAESTGRAAPFVHHRTVGGAHEVEPVGCEKADGPLNGLGCMDLERNFNVPANVPVSLKHGHFKSGADQDTAFGSGQHGDS
jgi:hypothetical protein